ncbi:MAG: hypothetical protein B5M54_02870 [Candidatus Aminicenantes bacterium 4484_214]|nr:MAG: hypothetical protein B5M54_02870 [Candidatus Aminicenantes bacterium 4484_214]
MPFKKNWEKLGKNWGENWGENWGRNTYLPNFFVKLMMLYKVLVCLLHDEKKQRETYGFFRFWKEKRSNEW